jgi:hypothetical protein
LQELSRKKPVLKNRVPQEIEEAIGALVLACHKAPPDGDIGSWGTKHWEPGVPTATPLEVSGRDYPSANRKLPVRFQSRAASALAGYLA